VAGTTGLPVIVDNFAVANVYDEDKHWLTELKAGTVTFDGSGWRQALQDLVAMNNADCFAPGLTGMSSGSAPFAEGQGLMYPTISSSKGTVDALDPQFSYTWHPFPAGTTPDQEVTWIQLGTTLSINAHSSPASQAAAREFIDFVARPEQNALYGKVVGGLTQPQIVHDQMPAFISSFSPILKSGAYVVKPEQTWWNPNVLTVYDQDVVGLITGQLSVDDVLNAMDAAWKQGPS
jgi:raffinose/stachyose/melibiose transport system substrate-binding protein